MGRQKNVPQMKEQEKYPTKELNKMQASDLLDIKQSTKKKKSIRMLKELSKNFNSMNKSHRSHKKEPVRKKDYNI